MIGMRRGSESRLIDIGELLYHERAGMTQRPITRLGIPDRPVAHCFVQTENYDEEAGKRKRPAHGGPLRRNIYCSRFVVILFFIVILFSWRARHDSLPGPGHELGQQAGKNDVEEADCHDHPNPIHHVVSSMDKCSTYMMAGECES